MEFQFGDWLVSPEANIVSNGEAKTQLEPRVMAVLRYLCRHPGAVIPTEEILQACWGSNELGDNPVHKAITQLRRAFGDSSTEPRYIETIRKRGYRAIAPIVTLAAAPSTVWEGGSPFRGLEAFQENHAAIFFGRVQATAQLRELVMTQAAHGCPMALVLGPSGSGKTSLVRAGLLPQLMIGATRSDEPVGLANIVYLDCADLGSGTLFQALAGALIDAEINGEPLFPGASADSLGQRLATDPDAVSAELRNRACARPLVGVFVDRLEAVFRAQPGEADRFIGAIEALSRSNCLLMLMACRNDFYPEVMAQPVLLALKSRGGHFDVLPPDGADIAQMVRQPAQAASLTFEKDDATSASLDDVLCDAARGNRDMLPLLQYTLNELYRLRDENGILRFNVYRQLGGIDGAVGVRAEQIVSRLSETQIDALPHVLSLLINVGDEQTAVTSRRSPLAMLRTEDEKELVRVMVEARLFVSELAGEVPSFGVAHEALLRQWPRVVEWIERYRHALQLRTRISSQAIRWENAGKPKDLLLPSGSQVNQAAELLCLKDFSLAPLDAAYVQMSVTRAKFGERVRLGATALIALLAILAGTLGLIARQSQHVAEQRQVDTEGLLTFMLGDFADKLRPLGKLELLDDVTKKALAHLSQPSIDLSNRNSMLHRAKALQVIAEINMTRAKPAVAEEALISSQAMLDQIPESQRTEQALLKQFAVNAFLLGQLNLAKNDLAAAKVHMTKYVMHADRFAAVDPNDVEGWIEQSYAHNSLGSVYLKLANYADAAKEFAQSLDLKLRAKAKRADSKRLSADIANSYSWLAESHLKLGDLQKAGTLFGEEQRILEPIQSEHSEWAYRLSLSWMRQASLYQALGQDSSALSAMQSASKIIQKLVATDPTNRKWQARLDLAQAREIELQDGSSDVGAKLQRLQSLTDKMATALANTPKNANLLAQLAWSRQAMTSLFLAQNRRNEATANLVEIIDSLETAYALMPGDSLLAAPLAEALLSRSEITNERRHCQRAAEVLAPLANHTSDYLILQLNVRARLCAGEAELVRDQISRLQKMGYNEHRYMRFVSSFNHTKGTP